MQYILTQVRQLSENANSPDISAMLVNMEVVVKLGNSKGKNPDHEVRVSLASAECSIGELLKEVRRALPPPLAKVLKWSEDSGSVTFLAAHPKGPVRLSESKKLINYDLVDGCTLWLMCAHIVNED